TGGVGRAAGPADGVEHPDLVVPAGDLGLLVPVGVQQHPALLQPYRAVVAAQVEGPAAVVARHVSSPRSRSVTGPACTARSRQRPPRCAAAGSGGGARPSPTRPRRRTGSALDRSARAPGIPASPG